MFELIAANPFYGYLFIFFARVADVSLDVFRLLLLTRGYAIPAAVIGFFEVSIFVLALGTVISGGPIDFIKIIAYSGGFATGNLAGSYLEEKMAFGFVVVQVFPSDDCCGELVRRLRDHNFGVTRIAGKGRSGPRDILVVTAKRKNLPQIVKIMDQVAPETFFNISDIRSIHGGVFPRSRP